LREKGNPTKRPKLYAGSNENYQIIGYTTINDINQYFLGEIQGIQPSEIKTYMYLDSILNNQIDTYKKKEESNSFEDKLASSLIKVNKAAAASQALYFGPTSSTTVYGETLKRGVITSNFTLYRDPELKVSGKDNLS